ncbi:MAG: phosphotransferase family protein, partial [Myxococcota bacterium]
MITASPRGARATAVLLSINVEGINQSEVTAWLSEHTSFAAPLSFQLITGGHSNLTYLVQDAAGKKWVLRRPPLNSVLATAHDMGREFAVVSALKDSDVPVPPLVGLCTDESVNGPAFYVMDFVEGTVARDASVAEK